jgi:hypothetical protein
LTNQLDKMLAQPMMPVNPLQANQLHQQQQYMRKKAVMMNTARRDRILYLSIRFTQLSIQVARTESLIRTFMEQEQAALASEKTAALLIKRHLETALEIVSQDGMSAADMVRFNQVLLAIAAWRIDAFDTEGKGYGGVHASRRRRAMLIHGNKKICENLLAQKK